MNDKNRKTNFIRNCLFCDKEFRITQFWVKRGTRKFCSRKCCFAFKNQRRALCKELNVPMKNQIKVKCLECDKPYIILKVYKKRSKFCSRKCYTIYRIKIGKKKRRSSAYINLKKRKCVFCQKIFLVSYAKDKITKCCSRKCAGKIRRIRVKIRCMMCEKEFYVSPYRIEQGRKFCSYEYFFISRRGENSNLWKGKNFPRIYPREFSVSLRKKIRKKFKYKCCLCGEKFFRGLHVHHLDANKQNNYESNFVTLCIPCHGRIRSSFEMWKNFLKHVYGKELNQCQN